MEEIVVGIDGDPSGDAALRWAVREARMRGARVRAVYAYAEPVVADVNLVPPDHGQHLELAREAAAAWRDKALGHVPEAIDVDIDVEVRLGPAGPSLIEAARGAALLVVGCREHHPLHRLVRGSVSGYCVAHACCPVVAVPG